MPDAFTFEEAQAEPNAFTFEEANVPLSFSFEEAAGITPKTSNPGLLRQAGVIAPKAALGGWQRFSGNVAKGLGAVSEMGPIMPIGEEPPPDWMIEENLRRQKRPAAETLRAVEANPLFKAGQVAEEAAPQLTPTEQGTMGAKVGELVGGGAGMALGPLAIPAFSLDAMGRHVKTDFDTLKERNPDMSDEQAAETALDNSIKAGAVTAAVFSVMPKVMRPVLEKYVVDKFGSTFFRRWLAGRAASSAEVGATMGTATVGENTATGQPEMQGAGTSTATGALMGVLLPWLRERPSNGQPPSGGATTAPAERPTPITPNLAADLQAAMRGNQLAPVQESVKDMARNAVHEAVRELTGRAPVDESLSTPVEASPENVPAVAEPTAVAPGQSFTAEEAGLTPKVTGATTEPVAAAETITGQNEQRGSEVAGRVNGPEPMPAEVQPVAPATASTTATPTAAPKSPRRRFQLKPRSDGVPDILDGIQLLGGIKPPGEFSGGEYDGFREAMTGPARILINRNSRHSPDTIIQELKDIEAAGAHRLETPDDLWGAIRDAVQGRAAVKVADKAMQAEGKQYEEFQRRVVLGERPKKDTGKFTAIPADKLLEGDTFEAQGQQFTVRSLEFDEHGSLISVEVKDGPKFGVQRVDGNEVLHVDKGSVELGPGHDGNAPPELAPDYKAPPKVETPEREPLTLNAPESVAEQRVRMEAEQADRQAKAAKEKIANEAAAPLKGTAGDLGQGNLLGEPEDLFAPPTPQPGIIRGSAAEKWADDVLRGGATHAGPDVLAAYAIKGAALLERGVTDFAKWSAAMVREFGDDIKPHLQDLFDRAKRRLTSARAYHGTPHKIEARFSTDKIGTGEGAQVYGYGLYFAENPEVARQYRKNLESKFNDSIAGKTLGDAHAELEAAGYRVESGGLIDVDTGKVVKPESLPEELGRSLEMIQRLGGNEYTVDLDVRPDELLDWDKPLSEQSPAVQKALAKRISEVSWKKMTWPRTEWDLLDKSGKFVLSRAKPDLNSLDGASIYGALLAKESPKAASDYLAGQGIYGIRYLDQGSRVADSKSLQDYRTALHNIQEKLKQWRSPEAQRTHSGDLIARQIQMQEADEAHYLTLIKNAESPTYNYVIFDDSRIHITHENTKPRDAYEAALDKLDSLKIDTNGKLHAFGLIPEVWNKLIDSIKLAVRAGRSLHDAVNWAIAKFKEKHPDETFDEVGARDWLEQNGPEAKPPEADVQAPVAAPTSPNDYASLKARADEIQTRLTEISRQRPRYGNELDPALKSERWQLTKEARTIQRQLSRNEDYVADLFLRMDSMTQDMINARKAGNGAHANQLAEDLHGIMDGELALVPETLRNQVYNDLVARGKIMKSNTPELRTGRTLEELTKWLKAQNLDSPNIPLRERFNLARSLADKFNQGKDALAAAGDRASAAWKAFVAQWKAPPTDTPFRSLMKDWFFEKQWTGLETHNWVQQIKQAVPQSIRRQAISVWLDAGGDVNLLRAQADAVPARFKPIWETALKLTTAEQALARRIKTDFAIKLDDAQSAGLVDKGRADYGVPQIWKNGHAPKVEGEYDPATGQVKTARNPTSRLDPRDPFFSLQRSVPSYFDGIMGGGIPADLDVGALVGRYNFDFHNALADRGVIKALKDAKAADGQPIVMITGGTTVKVGDIKPGEPVPRTFFVDSNRRPKDAVTADGRPYRTIDHWALKDWKFSSVDAEGNPIIVRGDFMVHPDHYRFLKNELGKSALRDTDGPLGNFAKATSAALRVTGFLKASKLASATFHMATLAEHSMFHAVAGKPTSERLALLWPSTRGVELDPAKNPDLAKLMRHGMNLGFDGSRELFEEGMASHGGLWGHVPGLGNAMKVASDFTFQRYLPALKAKTGAVALKSNLERYQGKLSDEQIYELTASQMNNAFGGQHFRLLGTNKTFLDTMRLLLLAPDFLASRMKVLGQALKPHNREQQLFLLAQAGFVYMAARVLNQLLDGDPHTEPENAMRVVHNGRSYAARFLVQDIQHLVSEPIEFGAGRLSPFTKTAIEGITGNDMWTGARKAVPFDTQNKAVRSAQIVAKDFYDWMIPIGAEGYLPGASARAQTGPGNLALSLVGVGSRKFTDQTKMWKLASDYNRTQGDQAAQLWQKGRDSEARGESAFARLDNLLDAGETAKAAQEYQALVAEGYKPINIARRYGNTTRPFTGTLEREAAFKRTLSPIEATEYERAIAERVARLKAYSAMKRALPEPVSN